MFKVQNIAAHMFNIIFNDLNVSRDATQQQHHEQQHNLIELNGPIMFINSFLLNFTIPNK